MLDYTQRYHEPPRMGAVVGSALVSAIVSGILKSGGTDTEKMADGFGDAAFNTPFGLCRFRAIDHQSTLGTYVGRLDETGWAWRDGGLAVHRRRVGHADGRRDPAAAARLTPLQHHPATTKEITMRALLLAATLLAAVPAFAQTPPLQRIRGTITSVSGDTMVVHAKDGTDVTLQIAPDTGFRADNPSTLDAIKPGSTLAIVSKGPADKQQAVAVRAMAPGVTLRMGILPWDLMPESTMTNAVVEGQTIATAGKTLTLKAGDKTVDMVFPAEAVIAIEEPGDKAMLTPGSHVAVFASAGTDNTMTARVVIIGLKGMTPPV